MSCINRVPRRRVPRAQPVETRIGHPFIGQSPRAKPSTTPPRVPVRIQHPPRAHARDDTSKHPSIREIPHADENVLREHGRRDVATAPGRARAAVQGPARRNYTRNGDPLRGSRRRRRPPRHRRLPRVRRVAN